MPWLTKLADVARRTGYPVTEVAGWRTRGHGPQPSVQGIVAHHTAGATAGGDYPALAVVRDGRAGLAGPLSHFGLGRSGRIYVIAAGRCWHNAPSLSQYHTNSNSIGIEAENDGRQPWPDDQLDSYKKLCAELCKEFGLPVSRVMGHKEVNAQKPDPHSVNMGQFRTDVGRIMAGEYGEDDLPNHTAWHGTSLETVLEPGAWRYVPFNQKNSERLDSLVYSVAKGPVFYTGSVGVQLASLAGDGYGPLEPGAEVQMRAVEVVAADSGSGFDVVERAPIDSPVHVAGRGHFTYTWTGNVQKNRRLRFQIAQFGDAPTALLASSASVLTWEY